MVALDEVASALGHSTPAVTARHYAHFVRKSFSPGMRALLQLRGAELAGMVLQLSARAPVSPVPADGADEAGDLRPTGTEVFR